MRHWRRSLVVVAAAGAVVLAGCGSGGGSGSSDDTAPSGSASASAAAGIDLAAAKAAVEAATTRPTDLWIKQPLNAPIPKNKTLYYIAPNIPYTASSLAWIKAATDAVGWKLVTDLTGSSPEDIKNAWTRAVNANPAPDAVTGGGFARATMEPEIQQLKAKGIPVILGYVTDNPGNGVTAVVSNANTRNPATGALQADWVVADANGKQPNTVFAMSPAFDSHAPQFAGFKQEYAKVCPGCEVTEYDVPISDIGSTFPEKLVSYLQGHPKVTHVVLAYGDYAVGLPTAMRNAGMADRVHIITDAPNPTVAKYIADDNVINAATTSPGPGINWQIVDILLRHFTDQDISVSADAPLPQWIITPKTVPSTSDPFPTVADYQQQFKKLWGVTGG